MGCEYYSVLHISGNKQDCRHGSCLYLYLTEWHNEGRRTDRHMKNTNGSIMEIADWGWSWRVIVFVLLAIVMPKLEANPVLLPEKDVLIVGIEPQLHALTINQLWEPVVGYLEGVTGFSIRIETSKESTVFWQRVSDGHYDLVYFREAHRGVYPSRYRTLVNSATKVRYVVAVHADSPVRSVTELDGMLIAMPDHQSGIYEVLRQEVRNKRFRVEPEVLPNEEAVFRAVAAGLFTAGGGTEYALIASGMDRSVRVVFQSDVFPGGSVAYNRRLSVPVVASIKSALLRMNVDRDGHAALRRIRVSGFEEERSGVAR